MREHSEIGPASAAITHLYEVRETKDEALHYALARVRAIREDLANNLSPLPDSLDALEAKLTAALRA